MPIVYKSFNVVKYSSPTNKFDQGIEQIISEHSIQLTVNEQEWLSFICSPIQLEALAVGFLWNEGIISGTEEINKILIGKNNAEIMVELKFPVNKPLTFHRTSTGFAIASHLTQNPAKQDFTISAQALISLFHMFAESQTLYRTVGGFHSAALSDGKIINITVEDVGRHNTLDKLAGLYLLGNHSFPVNLCLLTGRISSEMLHKAIRLGVPIIASRTTPTDAAIATAESNNITLAGYLRNQQFTIYSHPNRITL